MSLPTLRDLLELPAYASARVLCGGSALEDTVSWVHVSEVLDAARFLSGGELLLSTGVELARATPEARRGFVRSLHAAGAAGLALELVQPLSAVPEEMLEQARPLGFALLAFDTEVRFADLTRAAVERILQGQRTPPSATLEGVLIALEESGRAEQLIKEHLAPLLALKPRVRGVMLATLEALLKHQFNMAETARTLDIRRQTVYYRLEQLEVYLGHKFRALERQVVLLLALELWKRREGVDPGR